jgi:hypothetical protein
MRGRQALAFGLIILPSGVLYWARADWLITGLLAVIAVGMVLGLLGEGKQ